MPQESRHRDHYDPPRYPPAASQDDINMTVIPAYARKAEEQSRTTRTPSPTPSVKDKKSRIISDTVLVITFIITVLAMWYIFRQMNKVKAEVIYQRRKARFVSTSCIAIAPTHLVSSQAKIARATSFSVHSSNFSSSTVAFDPYEPDSDAIPLKVQAPSIITQPWDSHPPTNENRPNPEYLYAPQPRKGHLPPPKPVDPDLDVTYGSAHDLEAHGYQGRESMDNVGWEMHAQPVNHTRAEDMYGMQFSSAETVYEGAGGAPRPTPYAASSELEPPRLSGSPPTQLYPQQPVTYGSALPASRSISTSTPQ
ncbi:hypothetical protein DXG03_008250 [Asterophora parasitica]|uniref:Uncharacterized protein n=1 Tax=Asterophora parasitica TaxID=117018 RepID=A0A9P7G984_9AGAR|nr:hypothetical protein DXG03_008250 [Asterophora parasitica]